jgi:putative endonuclease
VTRQRQQMGLQGEQIAERTLRRRGMKTLARRYATPSGEIDLVMRDGRTVVFVEVKTQRNARYADPHERVRAAKQRRLFRAARMFLNHKRWTHRPCRFDVVSVVLSDPDQPQVEHIPDAFTPDHD